jgi:predicted HTH domain antitoxin
VHEVGFITRIYRDARSTEHKSLRINLLGEKVISVMRRAECVMVTVNEAGQEVRFHSAARKRIKC